MRRKKSYVILATTSLFCLAILGLAWLASNPWLLAGGGLGLCYVAWRFAPAKKGSAKKAAAAPLPPLPAASRKPVDPTDTDGLVEQMLAQGRFSLLLRPEIVTNLSQDHLRRAQEALEQNMALVPDGEVVLGRVDEALDDGKLDAEETAAARGRVVQVERVFLDRFPVTNRQFYEFVADGGYQQMALWEKSIWPAVLDLVDSTGMPGPHHWENGRFPSGEENHPVVGVSWYEANAYAQWAGKRLSSDAEWVKAGCWPVPLSADTRVQRKYPWGDTMDRERANLWGSRKNHTAPVDQFAGGVSVGGVYQLIGNVWEWTGGNFRTTDHVGGRLELPTPMKSIRGGAFDTYFDNQATCQFQSGENPLGRRHNIGFRCAVGVCDVVLAPHVSDGEEQVDDESAAERPVPTTEEVRA